MNRIVPAVLALTLALSAGAANAQQPGTYTPPSPVINPYLNLLHGGNPAINYYGIVRPQIQQNEQLQMLQFGLAHTAADLAAATTAPATAPGVLPDTGHTVGFMTYTRYFNTVNARGR